MPRAWLGRVCAGLALRLRLTDGQVLGGCSPVKNGAESRPFHYLQCGFGQTPRRQKVLMIIYSNDPLFQGLWPSIKYFAVGVLAVGCSKTYQFHGWSDLFWVTGLFDHTGHHRPTARPNSLGFASLSENTPTKSQQSKLTGGLRPSENILFHENDGRNSIRVQRPILDGRPVQGVAQADLEVGSALSVELMQIRSESLVS